MADKQKDADQEKPAPKAKAKPNLLENKAVVLGAIVIAQAAVAIGLTQFVIVPKLGVGQADMAAHAEADAHGKFKATSIPTGFVIDKDGTIRAHLVGAQNEAQLRNALAKAGIGS